MTKLTILIKKIILNALPVTSNKLSPLSNGHFETHPTKITI